VNMFATSIEPGQHAHLCSPTRLYTVGRFNSSRFSFSSGL